MALTGLTGIQITNLNVSGIATFEQTVGIAGTLTYEDVTNVDSVGLVTARGGIKVSGGQVLVGSGTSLHSTGLDLGTGNITGHNLQSTGIITATTFTGNGASLTNLNASNIASGTVPTARLGSGTANSSTFLAGDSTYKTVTGTTINNNVNNYVLTGTGTANTINGEDNLTFDGTYLDLGDNKYVRLGASNDFQMWHNGGTGNTNIKQVTGDMYFYTGSDLNMHMKDGTSVDLYYANSKRLETTSDGIKLYPDASGILIESGGDTNWTTGAMNVVRMGGNQADIRLGSNYGVKIGVSGNNDSNEFVFGQDNTNNGFIRNEASNKIEFQTTTSGTTRFRIDHNGNCTINDGDLVIGTAGHGIDFSATANAALFSPASPTQSGQGYDPSTDSEVLTHYEHGTWTPRLRAYDHTGGAGWGHMVYSDGTVVEGTGRYVRIGRLVWAGFNIESGSKQFDTGWTYWSIDTIPFGANHYDGRSGGVQVFQTNAFTDTTNIIGGRVNGADAYLVGTRPSGEYNATINTSNTGRYIRGHAIFYTSTG